MLPMTSRAAASTPAVRRVVLVPAAGRSDAMVRRYRLARLRLEADGPARPPHPGSRSRRLT
jgi:hypothetical protein